jgi:hypothetical protein
MELCKKIMLGILLGTLLLVVVGSEITIAISILRLIEIVNKLEK